MNCSLCDTANDDLANFCSQCGMPLLARECHACGAVFDKSASQCPKCGEAVPAAADSTRLAVDPPATTEFPAAVAPLPLALPGEADLTARLVKLLEQIEGELAARRVAATSFEEAPVFLGSASPARVQRTAAPVKPKRTAWLVIGGLVIAASGALFYRFHDQLLDQFHRLAQTFPTRIQSSGPAVAADPAAVSPASTPASPAVAAQSGPASAPATQVELPEQAKGAEPADAGLSTVAHDPPQPEAAPQAPASNAEPPSATTAPEAVEPAESAQSMPAARPEPVLSHAETTDAQPAGTHEEAVVAPTPDPKPADEYHCRDDAVSAMGLCGATSQGAR